MTTCRVGSCRTTPRRSPRSPSVRGAWPATIRQFWGASMRSAIFRRPGPSPPVRFQEDAAAGCRAAPPRGPGVHSATCTQALSPAAAGSTAATPHTGGSIAGNGAATARVIGRRLEMTQQMPACFLFGKQATKQIAKHNNSTQRSVILLHIRARIRVLLLVLKLRRLLTRKPQEY